MKLSLTLLTTILFSFNCFSQKVTKLEYYEMSTFSVLPNKYIFDMTLKTFTKWNYIDSTNCKTIKISKKKYYDFNNLLSTIKFDSIPKNTSTGGFDGGNYLLKVTYEDNISEEFRAWSGLKPKEFTRIENFIRNNYKNYYR